ncbi:MAG TPA: ABC transporter ATP-binding protein [Verrucomicrobiae bacterium]|nr:ABC transporter ATP-binding protein [Verrucomicrobiae bacterium]
MKSSTLQNGLVISAVGLSRIYQRGREQVRALNEVTFDVHRGEYVAVVGPSGAGKSTLLNLIGCMDAPTSGKLELLGKPVAALTEQERTHFRREQIGFVFQHFGLLPALTVAENVMLPAFFAKRRSEQRTRELLEKVGLGHRASHRPHELSGGEMQRAAIARALINNPALLLADEPTGNLDQATGDSIITLFEQLNRDGLTIVVVTHNPTLARTACRQVELSDGRLVTPCGLQNNHTRCHSDET